MSHKLHFLLISLAITLAGPFGYLPPAAIQMKLPAPTPESVADFPLPAPALALTLAQGKTSLANRIGDSFVATESLTYRSYVLQKQYKRVKLDYPRESGPTGPVRVSYAVLERHRKVLLTFDGIYSSVGNDTNFGLFRFLGGKTKRLVVSQDISRGGNQWVVSLGPRFRVIYDGSWFATGREANDLGVIDIDHDGIYEITDPLTDFYNLQDKLSISQIPLPEIIFKYDAHKGKYVPTNPFFADYLLRESRNADSRSSQFEPLARVLPKILTFIYAGQEKEAWGIYDREYNSTDKEEMRQRLISMLRKQPVYKYLYRRGR